MTVYNLLRTLNVFRSDGEHSPLSASSDYANGIEKLLFCFNVFLFRYFGLIPFCYTKVLSWTIARSISRSILSYFFNLFFFLILSYFCHMRV